VGFEIAIWELACRNRLLSGKKAEFDKHIPVLDAMPGYGTRSNVKEQRKIDEAPVFGARRPEFRDRYADNILRGFQMNKVNELQRPRPSWTTASLHEMTYLCILKSADEGACRTKQVSVCTLKIQAFQRVMQCVMASTVG
jgi:hypothetical protein